VKLFSALAAMAILSTSAAFAADAPAAPAGDSKMMSLKACNKQADEKKLTGAERTTFVKECRAAKK
jgi:hypothetical protein